MQTAPGRMGIKDKKYCNSMEELQYFFAYLGILPYRLDIFFKTRHLDDFDLT